MKSRKFKIRNLIKLSAQARFLITNPIFSHKKSHFVPQKKLYSYGIFLMNFIDVEILIVTFFPVHKSNKTEKRIGLHHTSALIA